MGRHETIVHARSGARTLSPATCRLFFQDFLLFDELTTAGNTAIQSAFSSTDRRPGIVARASEPLTQFGLSLEQKRTIANFSGGERQRVAIARALANDPGIILADELTASLDRDAADRVIADLLTAAHGGRKTLLVVTHDEALLSRMDRRLTVVDGRITADDIVR